MNYTGTIYTPPFEARSLLLQVTTGCSHNKCSFCTMNRNVPFRAEPFTQIKEDLQEASVYASHITRVFLENWDPFALSAARLAEIAELIHKYLLKTETIAMYASVKNIRNKTDVDLKRLRALGINELNIGVESGLDDALKLMNKGYTADEAIYELKRLRNTGIDYGANIIFGCTGAGLHHENVVATAALLNETKPYLIFTGTIHADPGCLLYDDIREGRFVESTFGEYLEGEEELLRLLKLTDCYYFGLYPSNVVPMHENLPEEQDEMLQEIARKRKQLGSRLSDRPVRISEGAIV